ncbi:MAG: tetratricopeptide repeat protein [Candidatus Ozemobacteraceae bacterium]
MKHFSCGFLVLQILFVLVSIPSFSTEVDWAAILARNPKDQAALCAMGKILKVPPELVQTKLLANDLLMDSRGTLASEKAFYMLIGCFEALGEFENSQKALAQYISTHPNTFKPLLAMAYDYYLAGKYQEAGNAYMKALPLSPDPWATSLAAVDGFLLAKNTSRAREILFQLQEKRPVKELWPFFGRLYFQMKDKVQGRKYFNALGAETEKTAALEPNSRTRYLYAVDCYLDAGNYARAKVLLKHFNSVAPGLDVDRKSVRYFSERKNFSRAIALSSKFSSEPLMQNYKGWAYIGLGDVVSAEKTFRNVLRQYPGNLGAKAGLDYTDKHRPWEFFLGYTSLGYGDYQDDRGLLTESLRYSHKKITTSFSHTRTDVRKLRKGAVDFNEDLYGGKISYLANQHMALQLHAMKFQNDDADTEGSSIFGGKISYFPHPDWLVGLGYDSSNYNIHHGTQFSSFLGYQFTRYFRADLKGLFTTSGGSKMRASQKATANGGLLKATYTPNDRFLLSLGGMFGERRLGVDADSLYAYNILDLYKNGLFVKALYSLNNRWKLYLGYSVDRFDSEQRAAANEIAGTILSEPGQTSKTLTAGGMYGF